MDYIKTYTLIEEAHTKHIDVINFISNKLEEFDFDFYTEKRTEELKDTLENLKRVQIEYLKELHHLEMLREFKNGLR